MSTETRCFLCMCNGINNTTCNACVLWCLWKQSLACWMCLVWTSVKQINPCKKGNPNVWGSPPLIFSRGEGWALVHQNDFPANCLERVSSFQVGVWVLEIFRGKSRRHLPWWGSERHLWVNAANGCCFFSWRNFEQYQFRSVVSVQGSRGIAWRCRVGWSKED